MNQNVKMMNTACRCYLPRSLYFDGAGECQDGGKIKRNQRVERATDGGHNFDADVFPALCLTPSGQSFSETCASYKFYRLISFIASACCGSCPSPRPCPCAGRCCWVFVPLGRDGFGRLGRRRVALNRLSIADRRMQFVSSAS